MSKFCSKCGQGVMDEAVICPHCGCKITGNEPDEVNTGLCVLSFLIPLAGLVLFAVYANSKPKSAKKYGMWALISVIILTVFYSCSAILMI